jgi:hypothetical protein
VNTKHFLFAGDAFLTFSVKRVVNDKLALENFVIAQAKPAKAVREPAQTFARGMWIAWMRIRRTHYLAK